MPRVFLLLARLAVTIFVLAFGFFVGLWPAEIPVIQARLEISPAALGLALLCAATGSLLSQVPLGMLLAVPILMSTAAQTPGMSPSIAVGAVGTMMTLGFLVGPPATGFVSQSFGLPVGLSIIGGVAVIVAVGAFVRRWPDPAGS